MSPSCLGLVDLSKAETLHGLAERIVAVESLIFLSKQYQFLQDYLDYLVPQTNKIMLQQFFAQVSYWVTLKFRKTRLIFTINVKRMFTYKIFLYINRHCIRIYAICSETYCFDDHGPFTLLAQYTRKWIQVLLGPRSIMMLFKDD